jgi:hypothetical protein
MIKRGCPLLAALLCVSCTPAIRSTSFVTREPRPEDHEISVHSATLPGCPFEEVGIATATKRAFTSMQDVLGALKERARGMGGDALVGVSESALRDAVPIGSTVVFEDVPSLTATVVRFTDPDCRT